MATTPLGQTRTHVDRDHAVIASDGHVISPMFGWENTSGVMLINHAIGSAGRPGFAMSLVDLTVDSQSGAVDSDVQRFVYVLEGSVRWNGQICGENSFVYLSPGEPTPVKYETEAKLLVFEKRYVADPKHAFPQSFCGQVGDRPAVPFMGDDHAMLENLLPDEPSFDMAVNVFTFQPGTPLPMVETHVMEHGLLMTSGQGVYRLGDSWYPVGRGDAIWMAPYCPQWFVAMGREPAQYIYYKDMHRSPLA